MKSDLTNSILTFALGVLVTAGVFFAVRTVFIMHEIRTIQPIISQDESKLIIWKAFITDVDAYNSKAKSPEITKMLQSFQPKSANMKTN